MYYNNITDNELQYFHELRVPNFTIKLTDILHKTGGAYDNKLFKVEEIITSKLYRIYPLFYTGTITSTNPEDRIIDDKLIIANKTNNHTYITFISDENEPVQDYVSYGSYYSIGDSLTDSQFNSIVALLRHHSSISRPLRFSQSTITGEFGAYEFTISTGFTDKGILINSNHLSTSTGFHIKLSNPVFSNSTYTLELQALRITDVNVSGESSSDNIEYIPVEVELVADEFVHIPVTDLEVGDILLYDSILVISHDQPVIRGVQVNSISVNSTNSILQQGYTSTLTFTAYDLNNIPSPNQSIDIYLDDSKVSTLTTNQNGTVTYNYTANGTGEHSFKAVQDLIESDDYDLLDCLFYDPAKNGESNNGFHIVGNNITTTNDSTGTLVTEVSGTSARRYSVDNPNPSSQYSEQSDKVYTWDNPLIIECDIISGSGNTTIGVRRWNPSINGYSDNIYQTFTQLGLTNGGHLKIVYDGTYVKYYVDNTLTYTSSSVTLTRYGVTFLVPTSGSFKYKDFKIYPYEAE